MKKIYLLLGMLTLGGLAQAQTCGTTVATFPHIQDFETGVTGSPGTLPTGWTMASTPTTSTYRWQVNAGPTSSTATGPNVDHTLGTATGKYVYTEASNGAGNDVTELISPCFNLTGLTTPGFEFWYHMVGIGMGPMNIDISTNAGTTWTNLFTFTGPQQANENDPWLKKTISLAAYTGQTVKIRFKGTKNATPPANGFDFEGDMAIDDFKMFNIPANDLELVAITSPAVSGCGFTATENVCITIKNNGTAATTSFPVSYQIGTSPIVTETATLAIAPGATASYCFTTKANLSVAGTYNFTVKTLLPTDGDPSNDTKTRTVTVVPNIATFPYNQNFDTGAGGWVASGANSSWALGTPAKPVIIGAASGTNSWVTGLTGTYNASENSQVLGPCFNMSSLVQPIISMKIWWSSEAGWDGAVLQSSIDGGVTWQNVGALNDPDHWYNDNSLDGRAGGQDIGWAGITTVSSGGWVTAKHNLTGLGGHSSVLLRIAFGSDTSVQYDGFAFDDVSIFESPANDVGITAITSPAAGNCGASATENVCVTIKNFGTATQNNIPVTFQLGTSAPVTETLTGPLAPGATVNYCFTTKANLSAGGNFSITACTALTGDAITTNNCTTKSVTIINPISTFPHIQDFESGTVGAPGTLPGGWTMVSNGTFAYDWEVLAGPTSSTATGPNVDHTLGTAAGKFVYTEASNGSTGDVTELISPCVNLAGLTSPGFDFWYHMAGATIGTLEVQVSNNSGTTWTTLTTLTGPQQAAETDPWLKKTVSLAGYTGNIKLRFKATRGTSFDGDIAIDDVKIYNIPANDAEVTLITLPNSGCGVSATSTICITVKNNSVAAISNIPVSYTVNGGTPVSEVMPGPLAPGASAQYCFTTKANLSAVGTYTIVGTVALATDGDPSNNTKTGTVTSVPSVSSLPYSQNFDSGNGGWIASGTNSSWALGTPAKPVINSASSGPNSWVTGLTGTYNASEVSQVLSPCFNFTGVADPDFEMKAWWSSEGGWDGAVLQSSINGGTTWQNVGALNDPNNWYNDNSLDGRAGGQDIGWAGTGAAASPGWVKVKHKLTGLGGQPSVRLRIAFGSDPSVQYDGFAFDDIRIGDNTGNLAINSFVPLTKICGYGSNEKVEVVLENLGSVAATGFQVSYTVDGGPAVTQTYTGSLAPGTPTNYIFPVGANLSTPGAHTIVVTVTSTGDPDATNNTVTYTITNALFAGLPINLGFETATTGISVTRVITKQNSTVTEGTAASSPFVPGSTKGMIMDGIDNAAWTLPAGLIDPWTVNPDNFSASYICFAPSCTAPSDSLWMTFDLKQLFKSVNANTNFRVTVNGTQVGPTYRPPFSGTPIVWQKIKVDLTPFKNQSNIQVGLESSVKEAFAAGTGTANLVDNIKIKCGKVYGVKDDILSSGVQVYPNPSTGIFNVSLPSTGKNFSLEVTDLTGKVIKQQTASSKDKTAQLKLNTFAQGVYLLKVTSDEASTVRRIVIQ